MVKKSENMVDKKNQWDNIEYTNIKGSDDFEEFDDSEFNEGEGYEAGNNMPEDHDYSEEDYDSDEEYDDASESLSAGKKNKNLFPLLLLVLVLIGVLAFFLISNMSKKNGGQQIADNAPVVNTEQSVDGSFSSDGQNTSEDDFFNNDSTEMVGMNFDDTTLGENNAPVNGNDQAVQAQATLPSGDAGVNNTDSLNAAATIQENSSNPKNIAGENDLFAQSENPLDAGVGNENNDIIISYDKVARINPFKPLIKEREKEISKTMEKLNNTDFEIVEPPVASVPDANLTRLLQTQVSGILYDDESPSAIVNLNGTDTFVKEGDIVSGYKIQTITRDKVQINYKNNSYVASVGALFVRGMIESRPAVANLEKKFAGRYKNN